MDWLESIIHVGIASQWGFLLLAFLIGLVHALEADYLAAIATMAKGKKRLFLRGAAWGLGHTVILIVISIAVVVFSFALTSEGAAAFEFVVGVMLLALGAQFFCDFSRNCCITRHMNMQAAPLICTYTATNQTSLLIPKVRMNISTPRAGHSKLLRLA